MERSAARKIRQTRIISELEANPLLTDEEIAGRLGVSVSTVRLERAMIAALAHHGHSSGDAPGSLESIPLG